MTIGKNKLINKNSKNFKKKNIDFNSKKECIEIKTPIIFGYKNFGKTIVDKTISDVNLFEKLKNRLYSVSLADITNKEELAHRIIKLKTSSIKNKTCETQFYGMNLTRDGICNLIKKWQTMIETVVDVKTSDNVVVRIFILTFSKKSLKKNKKFTYFTSSQVRAVRRMITKIVSVEANINTIKTFITKILSEDIIEKIENNCKQCFSIYNTVINKIKIL